MKEFIQKIFYWIYIKFLFFYKQMLHKKRSHTLVPVSFLFRLKQFVEYTAMLVAIGVMIYFANKLSSGSDR